MEYGTQTGAPEQQKKGAITGCHGALNGGKWVAETRSHVVLGFDTTRISSTNLRFRHPCHARP